MWPEGEILYVAKTKCHVHDEARYAASHPPLAQLLFLPSARCREGERNEGGAGSITRVLPNFFYDVKYVVGGTERGVDGCFLEKTELVRTCENGTIDIQSDEHNPLDSLVYAATDGGSWRNAKPGARSFMRVLGNPLESVAIFVTFMTVHIPRKIVSAGW